MGAQGGSYNSIGGYGGYSKGTIYLNKTNYANLYINVGGSGSSVYGSTVDNPWNNATGVNITALGGYNGGGDATITGSDQFASSGGGATHISLSSGLLYKLVNEKDTIIIVGAGGGAIGGWKTNTYWSGNTSAGGFESNDVASYTPAALQSEFELDGKATQTSGNIFGQGKSNTLSGGGGGYYGGNVGKPATAASAGCSSYIGNKSLYDKIMYCYNCQESTEESTKTISTTCTSSTPTVNCAKIGNGYARITIEGCSI